MRKIKKPVWKASGFTTVELLVVIATLVILPTTLLPALNQARERARQATCANNLKQIFLGFQLYAEDWEGVYPPGYYLYWNDSIANGGWVSEIMVRPGGPGTVPEKAFLCPSRQTHGNATGTPVDYGVNAMYYPCGPRPFVYLKKDKIKNPAAVAFLMDAKGGSEVHASGRDPNWPPMLCHSGGMNVLYFDGHAAWRNGVPNSLLDPFWGAF